MPFILSNLIMLSFLAQNFADFLFVSDGLFLSFPVLISQMKASYFPSVKLRRQADQVCSQFLASLVHSGAPP